MSEAEAYVTTEEQAKHFQLPGIPKGKLNTDENVILDQIRRNIRAQLPQVSPYVPQDRIAIITCGGPSLNKHVEEIRRLRQDGAALFAMNASAQWCLDNDIIPSCVVMMDARPHMTRIVETPIPGCKYLIGSQCHPDVFELVKDRDTYIWHADINVAGEQAEKEVLDDFYNGRYVIIEGGSTVGLRSMMLARTLGFENLHIFGFDGCYMDGEHHAYKQPENDNEKVVDFAILGRTFKCSGWQIKQYEDFINLMRHRGMLFKLTIHGDGLFAHVVETMTSRRMRFRLWAAKWLGRILGHKLGRKVFGLPNQEGQDGSASMEILQSG